jgi:hypothetical protein
MAGGATLADARGLTQFAQRAKFQRGDCYNYLLFSDLQAAANHLAFAGAAIVGSAGTGMHGRIQGKRY